MHVREDTKRPIGETFCFAYVDNGAQRTMADEEPKGEEKCKREDRVTGFAGEESASMAELRNRRLPIRVTIGTITRDPESRTGSL